MQERSRGFRYWGRLFILVAVQGALFVVLLTAAPVMGSIDLHHLGGWVANTPAPTVLTAMIRLGGLALTAWMLATTILYGLAGGVRGPAAGARGRLARFTLPALRRLIDGAAAVSIMVSAATTSSAPASATPATAASTVPDRPPPLKGSKPPPASPTDEGLRTSRTAGTPPTRTAAPISDQIVGRHLPHPGPADHNQPGGTVGPPLEPSGGAVGTSFRGLAVGTKVYVVQPGDCLSVIAERHLGDWRRDEEIDGLNRGRPQPDGRTLVDDHWIYPGWVLVMPPDATGTQLVSPSDPPGRRVTGVVPTPVGAGVVAAPVGVTPTAPAAEGISGVAPAPPDFKDPRTPAHPVARPEASTATPATPAGSRPVSGTGRSNNDARDGAEAGMTVLAAGAFVWGIRRRRREAMHDRPSGRRVRASRVPVQEADARARARADEETARWVDLGLRYLGRALLEREESTVPAIAMVRAASDGMEVLVAPPTPRPPRHFEAIEGGAIWVLDPSMDLDQLAGLAGPCWSFLPALVSLGEAPGGTVLVNLEHAGSLVLEGDQQRVEGLVAQMGLELDTQPWAEEMLASVDRPGLDGQVVSEARLQDLCDSALRTARRYQAESEGAPSLAVRRAATCQWLPKVVLAGADVPLHFRSLLADAATPDRSGVALVSTGPLPAARWRLSIEPSGQALLSGLIGSRPFEMGLQVTADSGAIALLEEALELPLGDIGSNPDYVVGAEELAGLDDWMSGAEGWASEDWEGGEMNSEPTDENERPTRPDAGSAARTVGFRSDAGLIIDLNVDEPPGPPAVGPRHPGIEADQDLFPAADLAMPGPVELTILGPIGLTGQADHEAVPASRRASALAVLCYLATRSHPVSADQIAAALWPADVAKDNFGEPRRKTVMNVISRARALLGESSLASSRLLLTDRGYALATEVSCDWNRFRALTDAAGDRSSPEARTRLRGALDLVQGEPFAGSVSRPFYEWVSAEHLDLAMVAEVVDTAERLGRTALDAGDQETAEWAVQKGLQLDPAREELYQVWMHAAGGSGRPDRVEEIYRRLCRALQRHIDAGLSPNEQSELVRATYSVRPTRV